MNSISGLRVAMIGTGGHGQLFPKILEHSCRGSKIVALVDQDSEALKQAARHMNVSGEACFLSVHDFLDVSQGLADAVIVSTPANVRWPVAECLGSGIHVFCENPLSLRGEEAYEAWSLHRDGPPHGVLFVDEQWHLLEGVQALIQACTNERVGTPIQIVIGGKGRTAWIEFVRIGTHLLSVVHAVMTATMRGYNPGLMGCCAHALHRGRVTRLDSHLPEPSVITATFETSAGIPLTCSFVQGRQADVRRCFIELQGTRGRVRAMGGLLEQVWYTGEPYDTGDSMGVAWEKIYPTEQDIQAGAWPIIHPGEEKRVLFDPRMNPTFSLWQDFEDWCLDGSDDVVEERHSLLLGWLENVAVACAALIQSVNAEGAYVECERE